MTDDIAWGWLGNRAIDHIARNMFGTADGRAAKSWWRERYKHAPFARTRGRKKFLDYSYALPAIEAHVLNEYALAQGAMNELVRLLVRDMVICYEAFVKNEHWSWSPLAPVIGPLTLLNNKRIRRYYGFNSAQLLRICTGRSVPAYDRRRLVKELVEADYRLADVAAIRREWERSNSWIRQERQRLGFRVSGRFAVTTHLLNDWLDLSTHT